MALLHFRVDRTERAVYDYPTMHPHQKEQRMPKVSVYVSNEDAPVWEEARKLLRFHQDEGLGTHLTPFLRDYISKEKARQAKKKD